MYENHHFDTDCLSTTNWKSVQGTKIKLNMYLDKARETIQGHKSKTL